MRLIFFFKREFKIFFWYYLRSNISWFSEFNLVLSPPTLFLHPVESFIFFTPCGVFYEALCENKMTSFHRCKEDVISL